MYYFLTVLSVLYLVNFIALLSRSYDRSKLIEICQLLYDVINNKEPSNNKSLNNLYNNVGIYNAIMQKRHPYMLHKLERFLLGDFLSKTEQNQYGYYLIRELTCKTSEISFSRRYLINPLQGLQILVSVIVNWLFDTLGVNRDSKFYKLITLFASLIFGLAALLPKIEYILKYFDKF